MPARKKSASQGETKVAKYCRGWQVGEKNLQKGDQHYTAGSAMLVPLLTPGNCQAASIVKQI